MGRILYLENQAVLVKGTVATFITRKLKHQVDLVVSLAEAQAELAHTKYDAVLIDILLDSRSGLIRFEESGLALAEQLLAGEYTAAGNPAATPIIIASGNWDATVVDQSGQRSTVEERAWDMGIPKRNFFRKPFLTEEIIQLLRWLLDED
jgi:CheY-like chemotaxis protein